LAIFMFWVDNDFHSMHKGISFDVQKTKDYIEYHN
jgi:hypothetical protein